MGEKPLTIKIADICIGIKPLHKGFDEFCKDYLTDEEADFVLSATEADLEEEQKRVAEYLDGEEVRGLELEKIWVYRQIAETIPSFGAFLIHAASVRVDGDAYLFLGPSGAGKTTQARLWKEYFGDRMKVINDDKPIIKVKDDEILVCGSPWCGKERWENNISAPLRGIFRIEKCDRNEIEVMNTEMAWEAMMNQVYRSADSETMQKILKLVDAVIGPTSIFNFKSKMEMNAARIAYEAIREVES